MRFVPDKHEHKFEVTDRVLTSSGTVAIQAATLSSDYTMPALV